MIKLKLNITQHKHINSIQIILMTIYNTSLLKRNICIIIICLLLCSITLFAQKPDTLWTRYYGATSDEKAFSIHITQDGGYVLVGHTVMGNYKVYFIKTDEHGNLLWTKIYGGDYDKIGYSIDETTDGGFIIAAGSQIGQYGFWLLRTDCNGDTIWTRGFEGGPGYSAHQTTDGGYIMGGGHIDHAMLIKTDSLGNPQWIKEYGNWNISMCFSVIQTADKGYLLGGYFGSQRVFLVKTDSLGDTLWTRIVGLSTWDVCHAVMETSDHYYIAVGGYNEDIDRFPADVFVLKYDTLGNMIWCRIIGDWGDDTGFSVMEDSDGNYVIVGRTNSFGTSSYDGYIIKMNPNGDTLWTGYYGTAEENWAQSIQEIYDGGYIIGGWSINGSNSYDIYLIRTKPANAIDEQREKNITSGYLSIYPNPFRNNVKIEIKSISNRINDNIKGNMTLHVYDINGRERKTLTTSIWHSYPIVLNWDGRDNAGQLLSNGIYILRSPDLKINSSKVIIMH